MLSLIVELAASEQEAVAGLRYAHAKAPAARLSTDELADFMAQFPETEHGRAPLALLPRSDDVVAVVPIARLSWHRVVLPRIAQTRWRSVLDSLLEERLLGEAPALLHLALQPDAQAGRPIWVAVCDKVWLKAQLDALALAGLQVSRVVPAYEPLQEGLAPQWHVVGSASRPKLVRCASDGVQCLPLSPAALVGLGMTSGQIGESEQVSSEPAVAVLAEQLTGARVAVQHEVFSLLAAASSAWNLAQFDLASTATLRLFQRVSQTVTQWRTSPVLRPVHWGVAALLLVQVVGLHLLTWKEAATVKARKEQVSQLLTQTFPKVTLVIDPPLQMARELATLRAASGTAGAGDLETLLSAVANPANAALGLSGRPTLIEFETGELRLAGLTLPPSAQAAKLDETLRSAGYSLQKDAGGMLRLSPLSPEAAASAAGVQP